MEEKSIVWDDFHNGLVLIGGAEKTNKKMKHRRKKKSIVTQSKIYCPHADLILKFLDILNPSQKIKFRKYYLRKVPLSAPDVIIIQDIKNLVMYLLITPVSFEFIDFFHLRVVDRFLRALILYFQFYTEIWEELMKKRKALLTKIPNPLVKKNGLIRADQMRVLRCILAREYCDLLVGCHESAKYHHMMGGIRLMSIISQSERDLRIFEALISISHRVVWIALQRKYFHLIEIELHRLFRSDAYNTASRNCGMTNLMLFEEERVILHGPKIPQRRKLLKNSPLVYQLFIELCDFRVVSFGLINFESQDPRINYLKNALLIEEEKLPELGINVGILGHPRVNYDITLTPIEDEKIQKQEKTEAWARKNTSLPEKPRRNMGVKNELSNMPAYDGNAELSDVFPSGKIQFKCGMYDQCREDARKKWILRELDRRTYTYDDTLSVATTGDN